MRLFVYGPLRFPEIVQFVAGRQFPKQAAVLPEYSCLCIKGKLVPGLRPSATAATEGVLYDNIDNAVLLRITAFQGPHYEQRKLRVRAANGDTPVAIVYITRKENLETLSDEPWDAQIFQLTKMDDFISTHEGF
jgi:gamma-glutamylcyclotransferase (GGCT)/AIG2-like uncharacterized protein YtfP